ncbi:RNA 2',3'-cyclic phosphodiesterase [Candidatus Woesearchaeota archaeon]|nr:RNA 2',3'-cyclic phosphodiesterase [Candidatus Woesearchaeota archaeon]
MRLFVAILFSHSFFLSLQQKLDSTLRFAHDFHLTLKFLGEVADSQLEDIKERLGTIAFKPFSLHASHIGSFPHVVWVGFDECEELKQLQGEIEKALEDIFPREKRDFKAHVTLARSKEEIKVGFDVEKEEFKVDSFILYKSTLTPEGPVYEKLASFPLV